jgi:hypothetical protein
LLLSNRRGGGVQAASKFGVSRTTLCAQIRQPADYTW